MVKTGRAWGRRTPARALPGVKADMMMIASRGNESRAIAETLSQFEAKHAAVEIQRTFEIRHLKMHMAESYFGMNRARAHSANSLPHVSKPGTS